MRFRVNRMNFQSQQEQHETDVLNMLKVYNNKVTGMII